MTSKVVLVYPRYDGPPLSAPLCLLSLAGTLRENGFQAIVIDAAVTADFDHRVVREAADALCVGFSVLTGPMIRAAVSLAQRLKQLRPAMPVILGGWHPSLATEQTLRPDFVDTVVRGQGELTLLEAVQRLRGGENVEGVRGLSYKLGQQVVHEPERRVESIDTLARPAYELADHDAYERVSGFRKLSYTTSIGCPYACHYCTDQVFYKRRFNAYPARRVVSELLELTARYRMPEVALFDSNYLVDVKRAVAISRGLVDAGARFCWTAQASTDFLCRMSDDDVQLLAASGLYHMGFGTESAAEGVLLAMNKKHQRIADMFEAARKGDLAGIHMTFNIILGYPGETETDRIETFRVMSEIARRHANVSFSPNIFTPYPGIPIWPQLREMGLREPRSLEEWADLSLGTNVLPWLQGEELRRLRRMLEFFLLNNQIRKASRRMPWLRHAMRRALGAPLRWRVRNNRYSFPLELWIARATERVITRRSLLTGQSLSNNMGDVC
jgi:anaerobic magnesium-protoporphyrin IX monomethyl ester cyclase